MYEARHAARQFGACQAILVRTHCRVRTHLWQRWYIWGGSANPEMISWALAALWQSILQYPNRALLATYLQDQGRQFCLDTLREARSTLRFLGVMGTLIIALAGSAVALRDLMPILAPILFVCTGVGTPIWLVFLGVEWIEYRTATYLTVAVEIAIERLNRISQFS